jgi:hypothetical protein
MGRSAEHVVLPRFGVGRGTCHEPGLKAGELFRRQFVELFAQKQCIDLLDGPAIPTVEQFARGHEAIPFLAGAGDLDQNADGKRRVLPRLTREVADVLTGTAAGIARSTSLETAFASGIRHYSLNLF